MMFLAIERLGKLVLVPGSALDDVIAGARKLLERSVQLCLCELPSTILHGQESSRLSRFFAAMALLTCKVHLVPTKHAFAETDLETAPAILKLRNDPRLLKLPPYISLLCMLGGVIWVLLLPLNLYSRQTYISENALLPGQVHTYFGGSEQNVFRAYKQELLSVTQSYNEVVSAIDAQPLRGKNHTENERKLSEEVDRRSDKIEDLFQNAGLKTSRQKYAYESAGEKYWGEECVFGSECASRR